LHSKVNDINRFPQRFILNFQAPPSVSFQLAFPINPYIIIRYTNTATTINPVLGLGGQTIKLKTINAIHRPHPACSAT